MICRALNKLFYLFYLSFVLIFHASFSHHIFETPRKMSRKLVVCQGEISRKCQRILFSSVYRNPGLIITLVYSLGLNNKYRFLIAGPLYFAASSVETRAVVNAARNSFTRMFDRLGRYYENITVRPDVGFRERSSLVKLLGRGLVRVLKRHNLDEKYSPLSPQVSTINIQYKCTYPFTPLAIFRS